jgi:hypothetical protein
MSSQLPNYLVANRKRLALSQEDVAFLLGLKKGDNICRHERFVRQPTIETVFAYEAIYKRTASEIFSGLYRRIEDEIALRARSLLRKTQCRKRNRRTEHRRHALLDIAGEQFNS